VVFTSNFVEHLPRKRDLVATLLPYTIKYSRLPRSTALVRLYLRLRFAWPLFGRQMFAVATRRPESPLVH
jgi:hypothetical protein